MNNTYAGKTIIITGDTRGIGEYLVKRYLSKGSNVIGLARSNAVLSSENYRHYCVDITDERQISRITKEIKLDFKRIDIVINNAGVASMNSTLLMPYATASKILNINVLGTFIVSKEAAKTMIKQNYGRIINISSVAVPLRIEGEAIYAASKAAVEQFTKVFAKELSPFGITVNAVGPAPMPTGLIAGVAPEKIEKLVNSMPINRLGEFRDVENAIDFFASGSSDCITGQVVYLGGVS